MNILVCDDDKEIAHAIEIYLRNEGYTVYKAYDGIGALSGRKRSRRAEKMIYISYSWI